MKSRVWKIRTNRMVQIGSNTADFYLAHTITDW
nr:MAG TPA: hypothetical protein [Caudoviricetes sp.]